LTGVKVALLQSGVSYSNADRDQPNRKRQEDRLTSKHDAVVAPRNMRLRHVLLAVLLWLFAASVGHSQTQPAAQDRETPTFKVHVWGDIIGDFTERIWRYHDLRSELEKELPALRVTNDPREIKRAQRALAKTIRAARDGAKQGDFFTTTIAVEFRHVLRLEMNADTWAAIMDDNPGEFANEINGTYPGKKPLSTVPPNILARLPRLPDDIQYRFVGRQLILHDTRANLVLDRIPHAISCTQDEDKTCDH
jgi:hypothetical protein